MRMKLDIWHDNENKLLELDVEGTIKGLMDSLKIAEIAMRDASVNKQTQVIDYEKSRITPHNRRSEQ